MRRPLTPRETDIMRLICEGLLSKEIAHNLGIALRTVEVNRLNILRKMGTKTTAHAAVLFDREQRGVIICDSSLVA